MRLAVPDLMLLFIKNLLFTVLVPGTVAVYLPLMIAEGCSSRSVWSAVFSAPVFGVGAAIYIWCVWDFATVGRGTPAPFDAPKRLVVRGLYRYTRNPMYLGVLTVILGWVVAYQTRGLVIYWLVVAAVFHLVVVTFEEPFLRLAFGVEYDAYRSDVARWLPKRRRPSSTQHD